MIEFTSGRPTFDVAHLSMHVQKRLSEKGNWMADLRPMLADGSMTSPDFAVIDPRGVVIAAASPDREELIHADLSQELVQSVRRRMQSLGHRRQDLY